MAYGQGWSRYGAYDIFPPYVPVAQRRAQAAAATKQLENERGRPLAPIKIEGRTIARSFWGKAWCDNLEAYSDYDNRLPRGRTYVRNGSVIDLEITKGKIVALVSGSSIYSLTITITPLPQPDWQTIQRDCAQSITSLIDLLKGRFDQGVMERLTRKEGGLFPKLSEIELACSCPDGAHMCKHIAAVMYGVGAKLDQSPELLFLLRAVDHLELISQAVSGENLDRALAGDSGDNLHADDLGQIFGIELESGLSAAKAELPATKPRKSPTPPKAATKAPRGAATKPKKAQSTLKGVQGRTTKVASAPPAKAKKKSAAPKPSAAKRATATTKSIAAKSATAKPKPAKAAVAVSAVNKPARKKPAAKVVVESTGRSRRAK